MIPVLRQHPDPVIRRLALSRPIAEWYASRRLRTVDVPAEVVDTVDDVVSRMPSLAGYTALLTLAAARMYPYDEAAWWELALGAEVAAEEVQLQTQQPVTDPTRGDVGRAGQR